VSFLSKTFSSLLVTRNKIRDTFNKVLNNPSLTTDDLEILEECLLSSDIDWEITEKIVQSIKNETNRKKKWEDSLYAIFDDILSKAGKKSLKRIIIMVGVNGVGKTTACAKLANYLKNNNKSVILVAADTFRAAAVEQLRLWSEKINVKFISNNQSSDPASIAFDGASSAVSKNIDHVIIDTAGRLQGSGNLMKELEKIYRVTSKLTDEISVIINLDSNIGQNSYSQVKEFNKYIPIDSIILNKMDGTSKGGIALSIVEKLHIPVTYIGVGESVDDFIEFDSENYIKSLIINK
jgi:fused signal recognition particle receptor